MAGPHGSPSDAWKCLHYIFRLINLWWCWMLYIKNTVLKNCSGSTFLLCSVIPVIDAANSTYLLKFVARRMLTALNVAQGKVSLQCSPCHWIRTPHVSSSYYVKVLLNSFIVSKIYTIMSVAKTPKGNFYTHLAHYFIQTVISWLWALHHPVRSSVVASCNIDVPAQEFLYWACIGVYWFLPTKSRR